VNWISNPLEAAQSVPKRSGLPFFAIMRQRRRRVPRRTGRREPLRLAAGDPPVRVIDVEALHHVRVHLACEARAHQRPGGPPARRPTCRRLACRLGVVALAAGMAGAARALRGRARGKFITQRSDDFHRVLRSSLRQSLLCVMLRKTDRRPAHGHGAPCRDGSMKARLPDRPVTGRPSNRTAR
jgi:hypothetical protein